MWTACANGGGIIPCTRELASIHIRVEACFYLFCLCQGSLSVDRSDTLYLQAATGICISLPGRIVGRCCVLYSMHYAMCRI